MATRAPENSGTGDYVKAPENFQREMPVGEQLGQIKDAARGKLNEFVDQSNLHFQQAKNDPSNKASDERLKQDVDATAKDAANSYNTAVNQVGKAVNKVAATGRQAGEKMNAAATDTANQPRSVQAGGTQAPTVLQSLGNAISQTAESVKGAFVSTTNEGTATPASRPIHPKASSPPVQSASQGIGKTAAAVTDAVKNAFAPKETVPGTQPGLHNLTTEMPQDVPRRAPK